MSSPTSRRFIVDTNFLIALEDNAALGHVNGTRAAKFSSLAAKHGFTIVVADGTKQDFLRANENVRNQRLLQLQRYHVLGQVQPTDDQRVRYETPASASVNDQCDLQILCALDNNAAAFLLSEDKRLLRKAAQAGLGDKALSLADALLYVQALEGKAPTLPRVRKVRAYQIPRTAPILDSIAADYEGFDAWWAKAQSEEREVLVVGDDLSPDAICVLKSESNSPSNHLDIQASLKLCTFKVAEHAPGKKFGELLLKAAIDEGRSRGMEAAYLTVMPDKVDMLAFLAKFGFVEVTGQVTDVPGELIYEKLLTPRGSELEPLAHAIAYGPGEARGEHAHIVPIQPKYVFELLPETQFDVGLGFEMPTRACGNAIRKAYLSNTPSRKVLVGDLLCFYMSGVERHIVATGVAEGVLASRDAAELLAYVGTRTVYTPDEVADLTANGEVLAVLFRFDRVVSDPPTFEELVSMGVLKVAPQSFVEVPAQKVGMLCQRLLT